MRPSVGSCLYLPEDIDPFWRRRIMQVSEAIDMLSGQEGDWIAFHSGLKFENADLIQRVNLDASDGQ